MKMKSCTAEEFSCIMYATEGLQTRSEGGNSHKTLYWERVMNGKGWSVVGIERRVNGEYTWEVPNFLYEAYIK